MNICVPIRYVFADKWHLGVTFWISIVPLQSWRWNWMAHSTMKQVGRNMMLAGMLFSKSMGFK